jgi:c-di-GMP-binding flagellar brake protein YcgR
VIFRHENPYRSRYRFRFGDQDAEALNVLFKRRASVRVRSDENVTIEARATESDHATSAVCTLRDVSSSGLSLSVGASDAAELVRAERLQLRFQLPGDPELFDVAARVRYRELAEDGVRYGLEIERSEVAGKSRVIERIDAYVERRKAAILSSALGASYLPKRG